MTIDAPAEAVAAVYRDAELAILERLTKFIAQGIDSPDWAQQKLARIQAVREMVVLELAKADVAAAAALEKEILAAYERGGLTALRDLKGVLQGQVAVQGAQVAAAQSLAHEISGGIASTRASVLGFTEGVVKQTISSAIGNTIAGAFDRRPAAQSALDSLLSRGFGSVELPSGRHMSMADYVSMATRTGVAHAERAGHTQTMIAADLSLIIVEPGPRPCEICDQWASCILSLDGTTGTVTMLDWDTGGEIEVEIDATIEEAIDDGFEHPNCRCSRRAYIPGITDDAQLERPPWDQEGYEAQQQQRELERSIREAKTAEATALSDERAAEARAAVADRQAALRELIASRDDLKRQNYREQIGRAI